MMRERFDEIFGEVMEELGLDEWYELFDSDDFEKVQMRIVDEFGMSILEMDDYIEWAEEMAEEL